MSDPDGKVALMIEHIPTADWEGPGRPTMDIKRSLPYIQAGPAGTRTRYVHRVRCGHAYHFRGKFSHIAMSTWCGYTGFLGRSSSVRGERHIRGKAHACMFAEPPEGEIVCATCEGRAVGAGWSSTIIMLARPITFSPRSERFAGQATEASPARQSTRRGDPTRRHPIRVDWPF